MTATNMYSNFGGKWCPSPVITDLMFRQVLRLVVESPAMNMESRQVCFVLFLFDLYELGWSALHSCRFSLKLHGPCPPSVSQISSFGITPCQVLFDVGDINKWYLPDFLSTLSKWKVNAPN